MEATDNHMGRTEEEKARAFRRAEGQLHYMPLPIVMHDHRPHNFLADLSQRVDSVEDVCIVCNQVGKHRIHDTAGFTKMASEGHAFEYIKVRWDDMDSVVCFKCTMPPFATVHAIASSPHVFTPAGTNSFCQCGQPRLDTVHSAMNITGNIESKEPSPHVYVSPNGGDTLGCKECRYSKRALHHIQVTEKPKADETIAEEAQRIVYGDREKAYDDPNQNFRRLSFMWQGVLDKKLAPGATITARDVALMMVCLKISRETFMPNRENRVDGIGYWLCEDRIVKAEEANDDLG